jgi:HSP20 family protein
MKLTRRERQDGGAVAPQQSGSQPGFGLSRLRREIDRLFDTPFGFLAPATSFFEGWTPAVDIYEDKDKYVIKAELPGMKKEEIEVSLDGNTLSISGERKQEEEKREGDRYRSERFFGRFQRSVTVPVAVQSGNIQAGYKDGVLTVTLPKSEESKPKQIQVNAS